MAKYAKPFLFTVVGILFAATLLAAPLRYIDKGIGDTTGLTPEEVARLEEFYHDKAYSIDFWGPIFAYRSKGLVPSVSILVIEWLILAALLFGGLWLIDSGGFGRLWLRIKTKLKK